MKTGTSTKQKTRILTECSVMIALTTVLSIIKLFEMPYGGSITPASMLPIVVIAHRYGTKVGFSSAVIASLIQALLGLKNFSYFTTALSLFALGVFDYLLAFGVFGIVGLFKKKTVPGWLSATLGAFSASILRYICHVISGATVWAGLSIPTEAAIIYSLSYNATYMIPETIILVLATAYITASLDFTKKTPVRLKREKRNTLSASLYGAAGLVVLIALIADTVIVFSKLQNGDSGELMLSGISSVNGALIAVVSIGALVLSGILILSARIYSKKAK